MATLLFVGLESPVYRTLESILQAEGHRVLRATAEQSYISDFADAAFCGGGAERYLTVFSAIRANWPGLPVIVVTQDPTEKKWLDAIEAGAADYCSAPFEPIQVRWILDAVLKHVAAPIAFAA